MKEKKRATSLIALLIILLMAAGLLSLLPSQDAEAQEVIIFEVTNTCPGFTPGGVEGTSLRDALMYSSADGGETSRHAVVFNIPADDPNHVGYADDGRQGMFDANNTVVTITAPELDPDSPTWFRITPDEYLCPLTWHHGLDLDGSTQADNTGDTNPYGPEIEIHGPNMTNFFWGGVGLKVETEDVSIKGLCSNSVPWVNGAYPSHWKGGGICLLNDKVKEALIEDCYIGTDVTGSIALPNAGKGIVQYMSGSYEKEYDITIRNNLISGNNLTGIMASFGPSVNGYKILNNRVGTDRTGAYALPNGGGGIHIQGSDNEIRGNLVSGNRFAGISVVTGDNNTVAGNNVGTDIDTAYAIPNGQDEASGFFGMGIYIFGDVTNVDVTDNVVSGNFRSGINVSNVIYHGLDGNPTPQGENIVISGNKVGTDGSGTIAIPNNQEGTDSPELGGITVICSDQTDPTHQFTSSVTIQENLVSQ